ncbi:MAG: Acb2/Tad1 domain-containing protein [Pseudobdellovibrionaceae bacterium]
MSRFDYVKYDQKATEDQVNFKSSFEELEGLVNSSLKPGRASALVLTKLEEAYMWVGKAIRDEQIVRNGSAELQESRVNS